MLWSSVKLATHALRYFLEFEIEVIKIKKVNSPYKLILINGHWFHIRMLGPTRTSSHAHAHTHKHKHTQLKIIIVLQSVVRCHMHVEHSSASQ
jgi:hypothetical protein